MGELGERQTISSLVRYYTPEELLKIRELRDGMRIVNVVAKVIEKSGVREVRSRYEDETGVSYRGWRSTCLTGS